LYSLELLNLYVLFIFLRDVFECSVLICFWRVRHIWHKNIVEKCLATEIQAVDKICQGQGTIGLFEELLDDFIDESDFRLL
jgi:hypothetical protein